MSVTKTQKVQKSYKIAPIWEPGGGVNQKINLFSPLGPLGLQMGARSAQSHQNGAPGPQKSQKIRKNREICCVFFFVKIFWSRKILF